MTDKLQFVIPGKPQYITIVRLAVGTAADTAGFDVRRDRGHQDCGKRSLQEYKLPRFRRIRR